MNFWALLRFHLASASRVALRAAVPQVVVLFVAVGLQPSPAAFLQLLVDGLATGERWIAAPWLMALWCFGAARLAAVRLLPATRGWHRHLAIAPRHHRWAMGLAIAAAQLPIVIFWLSLWLGGWSVGMPVRGVYLVVLLLTVLASASLALPSRRLWTLPLAGMAWLGAGLGAWEACFLAGAALLLRETLEVEWQGERRESRRRGSVERWLWPRITWRALGWKVAEPYPWALLLMASAWLFLRNNDVTSSNAAVAVRWCGGLACASVAAVLADRVRWRRPPWGWIRAQPWTSRQRVLLDAGFFALHAVPVLVASGVLALRSLLPLLALVAYLSLRASAALWRNNPGTTRLGTAFYAETAFVVLWIAVTPWSAAVLVILMPLAVGWAEQAEQLFKVSRFDEVHHHLTGETLA